MLSSDALPEELVARFTDLTPMPVAGAEAHLVRVRDLAYPEGERVLKVYFPHIEPDPDVWSQLAVIRSKHVIDVVETGTLADGRFFELMEYLPEGSLRAAGAGSRIFDTESIVDMVRQLTIGLEALHERGITHRDLKPDNVLVRGTGPAIELVLTDFGLSRRLNSSARFTTGARTSAYAAPEAWAGHVSPARDWWSLGIMVLELATGQEPFHGLDERMIQKAVTTKSVPVDTVTDPQLNRLCAGLLISDEKKRWNGEQVREWLAGGSPAVPDRRVPVDATAFEFDGQRFRDPESLAVAMVGNWRLAARRFGISPSPSWKAFTTWLHQFDDPDQYAAGVVEERLDVLGELEQSAEKPDAKLVRLLAALNPAMPPVYQQHHVDVALLQNLARQAQNDAADKGSAKQAHEIIGELWRGRLLEVLARFDGAADLRQIGTRWSEAVQGFRTAAAVVTKNPQLSTVFSARTREAVALAAMLELAVRESQGDDWLRALAERASTLPISVDWFADLLRWVGTDPVRAYVALYAVEIARSQAQQMLMQQQAAERARHARQLAWVDYERRRLDGRGSAVGYAVGAASLLTGLWVFVVLISVKGPGLVFVVSAVATHYIAEVSLARRMGFDYHPRYSLWQVIREVLGGLGESMSYSPRGWVIGIVVMLAVLSFVPGLVATAAVLAVIGHLIYAAVRFNRWSASHHNEHRRVLEQ